MQLTYENINDYLKENVSTHPLRHTTSTINLNNFEEVGSLLDRSYGHLSYMQLKSSVENEVIIGTYPLADCKILKCKTSGQDPCSFRYRKFKS